MEVLRVQTIAHQIKDSPIPSIFVRAETEQPGTTTVHGVKLEVPIIYFSNPDEETLQNDIMEAAKEWGMFQIVNHESPNDVIRELQSVGREFFELPQEEKEVIAKPVGYGTSLQKEVNGKKGWVGHLFHIIWPPSSSVNYRVWPNKPLFSILYFYLIIFPPPIKSPPPSPYGPISNLPFSDYHDKPFVIIKENPFPWKLAFFVVLVAVIITIITTACIKLSHCFSATPTTDETETGTRTEMVTAPTQRNI